MSDALRFKITVEAYVEETRVMGNDWAVVGQKVEDGEKIDVRGYTPQVEKTTREMRKIYEQSVEELDIGQVVSVVNGLPVRLPT